MTRDARRLFSLSLPLSAALALAACAPAEPGAALAAHELDDALPEGAGGGGEGWLSSPIDAPRVTSHVSNRRSGGWARYDCTSLSRANHRGTDFGVPIGTPVYAAAAGTVLRSVTGCPNTGSLSSSCGGGFGNHVIVLHDGGYATLYAHFSPGAGQVRRGARVECGELLGRSGHSGRSTGPHLHFEVRSGVSSEASYFSARTIDPWGGACSSQRETLWIGGSPGGGACTGGPEREDAVVARATYGSEVRGTPGLRLSQTFTMRNTGTTTWEASTHTLVHTSGAFGEVAEVALPAGASVPPGRSIDLRLDVTTPSASGLHRGAWRMAKRGAAIFGREAILAVRVPTAPRACDSATLGTRVESGSCVQVSYPGCGMDSCAWYACSDGAWLCTSAGACAGEAYPNDRCAPPAMPVPDGGTGGSDGGTPMACEGGGAPLGGACERADECCDGLSCSGGAAGASVCCHDRGTPCARQSDCCGAMACTMGFCACVPENQLCWNDGDCCDGLSCVAGACRRATGGLEQAACSDRSDCTAPLSCQASSVGGPTQCCVSGGNRCEADGDCCGEMQCADGHCAPRQRGESCANLLDCAGAFLCRDSVCAL